MFISLFISLFCILLFIFMFSASILANKAVYKVRAISVEKMLEKNEHSTTDRQ